MHYEIRAMSFAEILDTALRLVTNHFVLFVSLMAVANLPTAMVASYLAPDIPQAGEQVSSDEAMAVMTGAASAFLATLLMFSVLFPIAFSATTHAIGESYRGRELTFGEALQYAMSNLMPMVGTWMLTTLFVALGFLCLVIPGIYLGLSFAAVWPIMVVERMYGMRAIHRSRELMSGNLLRALGVFVVAGLIGGVLGGAAELVLTPVPVLNVIGGPLVQSATAAYTAAAQMVLYFDIRCRKEGFDIEHLAERVALQGDAGAGV